MIPFTIRKSTFLLSDQPRVRPAIRNIQHKNISIFYDSGPGSSVGIVTDYGLDGPGIESRWGWDFPPVQTGPGAHPASGTMATGSFPGVKCGLGVLLTTHPLLALRSWKSRAIHLPPLGHNRACNGVTLLYRNSLQEVVKSVGVS